MTILSIIGLKFNTGTILKITTYCNISPQTKTFKNQNISKLEVTRKIYKKKQSSRTKVRKKSNISVTLNTQLLE